MWFRQVETYILNRGTIISHGFEIVCPLGDSKDFIIMQSMVITIPSMEFNMSFMDQNMQVDYDIRGSKTQGLRGNLERLITIALLDYKHQYSTCM